MVIAILIGVGGGEKTSGAPGNTSSKWHYSELAIPPVPWQACRLSAPRREHQKSYLGHRRLGSRCRYMMAPLSRYLGYGAEPTCI